MDSWIDDELEADDELDHFVTEDGFIIFVGDEYYVSEIDNEVYRFYDIDYGLDFISNKYRISYLQAMKSIRKQEYHECDWI